MAVDYEKLFRHMIGKTGESMRQLSVSMGKTPGYVSSVLHSRGNGVNERMEVGTLVRMADACGYEVRLVGHGETINVTEQSKRSADDEKTLVGVLESLED